MKESGAALLFVWHEKKLHVIKHAASWIFIDRINSSL